MSKKKNKYICPMDQEVSSDVSGACTKCGMALERVGGAPSKEEEQKNPQKDPMLKRLLLASVVSIPVLVTTLVVEFLPNDTTEGLFFIPLLLGVGTTFVLFYPGFFILKLGYASFKSRNLNMFSLIGLGVSVAWLASVVSLSLTPVLGEDSLTNLGTLPVYFDAAVAIVTFTILGQYIEGKARTKVGDAITSLLNLTPPLATKITKTGKEEVLETSLLQVGDMVVVRHGESVPADGAVVEGVLQVDESFVTGESLPVLKEEDDEVIGGTLVVDGYAKLKLIATGEETVLSKIADAVSLARLTKGKVQRLVDKISSVFTPMVLFLGFITAALWGYFGVEFGYQTAIVRAVSVLIIACPCALGLATPMSLMVGLGLAARRGILFNNADAIQSFAKFDTLAFDKTGTITESKITLSNLFVFGEIDKTDVLSYAASLSKTSTHPISKAIFLEAKKRGVELPNATNIESIAGLGVCGQIKGVRTLVGNSRLMRNYNISLHEVGDISSQSCLVALGDKVVAKLEFVSKLKSDVLDVIDRAKMAKIRLVLISGDNEQAVQKIAKEVGIEEYYAEQTPKDKLAIVERLKREGRMVAMVGDGINDALALSAADLGIAVSGSTDIALKSGDVALIKPNLELIFSGRKLAQRVQNNIRLGLVFALGYNVTLLPLAGGLLFPFFGLVISPVFAALAMSLSSTSVILNALSLNLNKQKLGVSRLAKAWPF